MSLIDRIKHLLRRQPPSDEKLAARAEAKAQHEQALTRLAEQETQFPR